jgi:Uma2 family endonuclease
LEEKPVSDYAQFRLYLWFLELLKDFLHVNPIARMIGLEVGFRMALPTKTVIRKPDLAVVLNSNVIPLGDKDRSYKGIFDICIESVSNSSRSEVERDTKEKKSEYAAGGVREYYILDERRKETEFYHLNHLGVYVPIKPVNGIIHSTVLPGFQFRLADLYDLPQPPDLLDDEVYSGFVSPFLRAERILAEQLRLQMEQEAARAEQEAARAEQEAARAEQEAARAAQAESELRLVRERAERYKGLLKTLGINPESLQ